MDTSVAAAVVTSGVALVVAVGGGIRNELRSAADRRYERRRTFLIEVQDAALELRNTLREYGSELRARTGTGDGGGGGIFIMSVPEPLATAVSAAEGLFTVASSRVEDEAVVAALTHWYSLARVSLIDTSEAPASAEQHAFNEVNDLIGAALKSGRGRSPR
ncbi:MAG: hypothetical protein QOC66_4352 [Pseudonocardiales bacterium]|nr:hypothetical protein [Pseudonocardiales bacterium]